MPASGSPTSQGDNVRDKKVGPRPAPEGELRGLGGAAQGRARGPAPVHLWNPPDCGDIDMRIAADGTWFYCGSPIGRAPLVQLFSSILRRDGERYVLVTPVEKLGVKVDDAPFVAVEMRLEGDADDPRLTFRTNVDDMVTADEQHPLRFERAESGGMKPYVRVRGDLWALVKRALFYDLAALGRTERWRDADWFGVRSCGAFFPMCPTSEIAAL